MTTKEKFELIKAHEGVIKNIKKTITLHEIEIAANQKIIDDLWLEIKDAVDATPEKEIIFAGDVADLKIHYKKVIVVNRKFRSKFLYIYDSVIIKSYNFE